MNCPSCGKEMEKGRLTAGSYRILWLPEGESTLLPTFNKNVEIVTKLSLSTTDIPAYICKTCRKVIADY